LGGLEVAQLEALREQALDLGHLLLRLGRERDVVHKDGHDHLHAVLLPDEHRRVRADAGRAQLDDHLLEATEPLAAALLEAVEPLEQASNPGRVTLSEAVGLLHVDVDVVQLAVEVGVADVDGLQLEVLERGEREDGAEGSPLGRGSERLVEIDAGTLAEAIGDEAGLVVLDGAVGVALDLEDPLGANSLAPGW
jgi:hypothetical protein